MQTVPANHRPRTGLLIRGAAALTLLVVLGTLAGRALPSPTGPSWSFAPGSPAPGSSPASWAKVTLPPSGAVAEIAPTLAVGRSVAIATAFTIRSLGALTAVDLASRLTAEPSVTFAVE